MINPYIGEIAMPNYKTAEKRTGIKSVRNK